MYLKQYIGSLSKKKLSLILRFVTGSCVFTTQSIQVTFNNVSGFTRRPIAHMCACMIELSVAYDTFMEFENEIDSILIDKGSFIMSAI